MAGTGKQIVLTYRQALALLGELDRVGKRLRSLEECLRGLMSRAGLKDPALLEQLELIDIELQQIGNCLMGGDKNGERSVIAVEVMNLALDYWTESTGKTKFELASESMLWKVYTNHDGWERAQTLDKYLELWSLPKNPRWKKVSETADFVLANCDRRSPLRVTLQSCLSRFRIF